MAEELRPSRIQRRQPVADEEDFNGEPHISSFTKLFMIVVAIVFDIISIIPGMNEITILISDFVFIPWFYMLGVKFTGRRIASFGVSTVAEAIPFVSVLPMITINVIICFYLD